MDRQKVVIIFGAALISAALLTWFLYAQTVAPKKDKMVMVVAAAQDLQAGARLARTDIKRISLPEKNLPKGAMLDEKLVLDRALLFPVSLNEAITTSRLTSLSGASGLAATIEAGKRAVSVQITDVTSAGGLIQPRSRVDVLFTKTGTMAEAITTTILEDVVVLSIGRITEAPTLDARPPAGTTTQQQSATQTRAATLLVTPEEARKLELAKNQGKISLALRNPLDRSRSAEEYPTTTAEVLDPDVFTRAARSKMRRLTPEMAKALKDDKAWAQLIGAEPPKPKPPEKKEPPKPRAVIDVFRGDKHVQETFY